MTSTDLPAPLPVDSPAGTGPALAPRRVVGEALRLVFQRPREVLLPTLVITAPVGVLTGIATIVAYFTAFADEPVFTSAELFENPESGQFFLFIVLAAVEALFAQVARGATTVSVAGLVRGRPLPLAQALDPAFTRMGGLILIFVVLGGVMLLGLALIVGLVLVPYFAIRTLTSSEAYMLENLGPWAAIRRAWALTRGRFWRTAGTFLLAILTVVLPVLVVTAVTGITGGGRDTQAIMLGISTAVQAVLLVPVTAFMVAVTTLIYLRSVEDERRGQRSA